MSAWASAALTNCSAPPHRAADVGSYMSGQCSQRKKPLRLCFHFFFFFKQSPFYLLCKVYTFEMFEDRRPGMTGIPKPCIRRGSSVWVVTRCGFPPTLPTLLPPPPYPPKNVGGCIGKDMRGNGSRCDCMPLQLIWPIRWRRRCAL